MTEVKISANGEEMNGSFFEAGTLFIFLPQDANLSAVRQQKLADDIKKACGKDNVIFLPSGYNYISACNGEQLKAMIKVIRQYYLKALSTFVNWMKKGR